MSAGNLFEVRRRAFGLREKSISAAYTVKVGGSGDNFIEDRVIKATTISGTSYTITVPNGSYAGQRLLIVFEVEGNDETVTLTPTTGSLTNLTAANGYSSSEWINNNKGWRELAASGT